MGTEDDDGPLAGQGIANIQIAAAHSGGGARRHVHAQRRDEGQSAGQVGEAPGGGRSEELRVFERGEQDRRDRGVQRRRFQGVGDRYEQMLGGVQDVPSGADQLVAR
ncbi:hypothetical protein GCM10012284_12150 [Mangrovihabitans endophyticus]|uniref:Uncharacterized protein n=1 Tax=Mangrovihabitans endophyticus TaxID=1751298 RepID=A0A8J3BXU8_9ACTN|nr:hypothetical protein [Mangrovihabitans endophyticus]GGK79706.1 hypothetical protein GCM10012284_12150 [Mangrovihabitans endophyticus]